MGDQRYVAWDGQAEITHRAHDTERHDQAGAGDCRRRVTLFEQSPGGAIAILLGHGERTDMALAERQPTGRQRPAHAALAMDGEGLAVVAVDQRQPPVSELDKQPCRLVKGALIVDVGEGIVEIEAVAAAMDDERDAKRVDQRHPPVGRAG